MKLFVACASALVTFGNVTATQLNPWLFEQDLVIEAHAQDTVQIFNHVNSDNGDFHYHSIGNFLNAGAGISGFDYSGEVELIFASTRQQSFDLDNARATARYRLRNDIAEGGLSTVIGFTIDQALRRSLDDISSFHHGLLEGELHLAFGKEYDHDARWIQRWWGLFAVGCADVGYPWLRGHVEWECNHCDQQRFGLFADFLRGLGNRDINKNHFHGYGKIRHQSIDVGTNYTYIFDSDARLTLQYAYRIYARNFPANTNRIQVNIVYPFGL